MEMAERYYNELKAAGVDVLLDDRDVRPGVKFKDADLIGFPLRVVIGGKGLAAGEIELKWRDEPAATKVKVDEGVKSITQQVEGRRAALVGP